ncbi:helix-turn-helix domain-containing protein, partial [Clostridium coskatii]
ELGKRCNVSGAYIQQLELGQKDNPSLEVLCKLSVALKTKELLNNKTLERVFNEKLSWVPTNILIEELNNRKDFPIKIVRK